MSRNQNSRFALNPTNIDIPRSTFSRNSSLKTSFNVGDIVPFYVDEVLPGDSHQIKTSKVVRLQTLITPMMDNLYLDTYFFFVPNRLTWEHWKQFQGENTDSAWIPQTTYTVPQLEAPSGGWNVGTIADYMGIPTGIDNISVNALPFRAYALICDQWFRDQNLSDPLNVPLTDATVTGVNTGTFVTDVAKGGLPYTAAKYHDYFTSALPAPQKGPDVTLGIQQTAPVYGNGNGLKFNDGSRLFYVGSQSFGTLSSETNGARAVNINQNIAAGTVSSYDYAGGTGVVGLAIKNQSSDSGLIADLSDASLVTINQLRLAFQLQKLLEKDARGGKFSCLHVKKIAEKIWKAA